MAFEGHTVIRQSTINRIALLGLEISDLLTRFLNSQDFSLGEYGSGSCATWYGRSPNLVADVAVELLVLAAEKKMSRVLWGKRAADFG